MLSRLSKSNASTQTWLIDIAGIVILLGVFYAIWIGSYPLFPPDEGRYPEVAREMVVTGDYITPRLNGVAFLDKPILYYWLQASAIKMFGLNEAALRFWPAFMGVLSCLFVYLAGRQLFSRRTGILSAAILATSPLFYGGAHYANLDLEVASLISITLLCFLMATQATTARWRTSLFLLAYVFSALACLTKGLIGIAFPIMISGAWILILNRWDLLKKMRLLSGILVFSCMTIPWYMLVQKANPQFFHFFFVTQQVSRFLTAETFNSKNAAWFYLPIVFLGFFPWSIFLVQTIWQNLCNAWKSPKTNAVTLFLLLWVVSIFVFFSIPHSKTIGYILPIFPGLALLVGDYLNRHWDNKNRGIQCGLIFYVISTPIIFTLFLLISHIKALEVTPKIIPYLIFAGTLFLLSGLMIFLARKSTMAKITGILLMTATLFILTMSASSNVLNQKTVKPLALYLKSVMQPTDEIATYYKYYQDLPIYLEKRITIVADWTAPDIAQNDNWLREMWYGIPFQNTQNWLINSDVFWHRWHSKKHLFLLMNEGYFQDFCAAAHSKVYQLKQFNDIILVSNQPIA